MAETKTVKVHYRALRPNGDVWGQSVDPKEIASMASSRNDLTFERRETIEVVGDWHPCNIVAATNG